MNKESKTEPFENGMWIVKESGEPRLLGSECVSCRELFFPRKKREFCPRCQGRMLQPIELGPNGKLVAFSVAEKGPGGGYYHGPVPYCYGLVELDEGIKIKSHLKGTSFRLNERVKLIVDILYTNQEGNRISFYCFEPCSDNQ